MRNKYLLELYIVFNLKKKHISNLYFFLVGSLQNSSLRGAGGLISHNYNGENTEVCHERYPRKETSRQIKKIQGNKEDTGI